ncbi:MAG TPA: metallophosphoesterase family protein [Gemmatimonadaceae bacterium]
MRVAAIYDIHSNLPALEAVLDEIGREKVDQIVVGGDVVPGPMPRETIDRLLAVDLPMRFITGNGDREIVARMRGIETGTVPERFRHVMGWVASQLGPADETLLASWHRTTSLEIDGLGNVMFCHATPRNDMEIFTRQTAEAKLRPIFEAVDEAVIVCGHTHMQFDRRIGSKRVVNAGSVGLPFGNPGAYWLMLGPDVELRHTLYDFAKAGDRVRATPYPEADSLATRDIPQPASEAEMIERFSKAELK